MRSRLSTEVAAGLLRRPDFGQALAAVFLAIAVKVVDDEIFALGPGRKGKGLSRSFKSLRGGFLLFEDRDIGMRQFV
jgi:hypothetical protein